MGCLRGEVALITPRLEGRAGLIGGELSGEVALVSRKLLGQIEMVSPGLSGQMRLISQRLQGYAALVCRIDKSPFVKVTPEVVWLTDQNNFTEHFDVTSNTEWRIE